MLKYKNYMSTAEYDNTANLFHGQVINSNDIITFQGSTAQELEKAFKDSINDYLDWCKTLSK